MNGDQYRPNLNDCGCCDGLSLRTPGKVYNRPGLSAIAYRVGTHEQFRKTMLARLSGVPKRVLQGLTTRDNDDFSISLIDAWAAVADVLTFYQERIANELYLRTATERLSLLELARLIDYELRPGVAAGTHLAFTIEDAPGAFGQSLFPGTKKQITTESLTPIMIDIGTKVQSVPGPEEQAQIFETTGKIEARAKWNAIRPRLTQPQHLSVDMGSIILQGTDRNLNTGDTVLIIDASNQRKPMKILEMTTDDDAKTTRIDFESPQLSPPSYIRPSTLTEGKISDYPDNVELDENVVADIISKTWKEEDLSALIKIQGWPIEDFVNNIAGQAGQSTLSGDIGVYAFRQRSAIFGYNAPKWDSLPANIRFNTGISAFKSDGSFDKVEFVQAAFPHPGWEGRTLEQDANADNNLRSIYLDITYPAIVKDSWLLLTSPLSQSTGILSQVFKVKDNVETTRSDFSISGKISQLRVESNQPFSNDFKVRTTTVQGLSEQIDLADVPIDDLIGGDTITLDRTYLGLKIGRRIIIAGERNDFKGIITSEIRTLKDVIVEAGFTVITLDKSLDYDYVRNTVKIRANVALGTHGESVEEILGSGDAGRSFQSFTLRQPPLTYISASTQGGSETTLEIRVNDLLWKKVSSFYSHGPEKRIYITRTDDYGRTTVMFGDGLTGERLPTGQENVKAKYRKGIGLSGLVKADQLSQLMTKPLGVKEVTNPMPSNGAAGREERDEARRNAPLTVLTLGRIVSLRDYEDYARAFAGIDKALATSFWIHQRRGVFVTVAGSKGEIVLKESDLYENLLTGMKSAGDQNVPLVVESYVQRFFRMAAKVQVKPEYLEEKVLSAVEEKLREDFSFVAREFGQIVARSEIISVIQNVAGVKAVNVTKLYRSDEPENLIHLLDAALPRPGQKEVFAAELLTLDPRPAGLEVLT